MAKMTLENLTFGQAVALNNYLKNPQNLRKIMGNISVPKMESVVDTKTHQITITCGEKNE